MKTSPHQQDRYSSISAALPIEIIPLSSNEGDWSVVHNRLCDRLRRSGVTVRTERLGPETTGIFDGTSITTNAHCDLETQCHNMGHAFGHIIQWSLAEPECQALYDALYRSKDQRQIDPVGLEQALEAFREYEVEASQYAAGLLIEIGCDWALPSFTLFARADIEAIVTYHRTGIAPIWTQFFDDWQAQVRNGQVTAPPFAPLAIPPFTPLSIAPQEVVRGV